MSSRKLAAALFKRGNNGVREEKPLRPSSDIGWWEKAIGDAMNSPTFKKKLGPIIKQAAATHAADKLLKKKKEQA